MNTDIQQHLISSSASIRDTFKKLDSLDEKYVLVTKHDNKVLGIVTSGDFRRAIWESVSLEDQIETITNKNFVFVSKDSSLREIKKIFKKNPKINHLPVIENGKVINLIKRKELNQKINSSIIDPLNIPVVIMAGGNGTRLDPLTRILPKPLLPVGDKPVIEIIMNRFMEYGINDFIISIREKGKMIKAYFDDYDNSIKIKYLEEDLPLGTIGALSLIDKEKINSPFIVSNCDTIINADYSNILNFHREGNFELTMVVSMQHLQVPFGVCNVDENGGLVRMDEKPEYDFLANTGLYFMEPTILDYIPASTNYDINQLIFSLIKNKRNIGVYPVSKNSWIDVGRINELEKAFNQINNDFLNNE